MELSRQDSVYILVGFPMGSNITSKTKGRGYIGTKLLPDTQLSVRLSARNTWRRRVKEIYRSLEWIVPPNNEMGSQQIQMNRVLVA